MTPTFFRPQLPNSHSELLVFCHLPGLEVYCLGGGLPASSPEAQACRDANLTGLQELLSQVGWCGNSEVLTDQEVRVGSEKRRGR
jgi:hypothetical protein